MLSVLAAGIGSREGASTWGLSCSLWLGSWLRNQRAFSAAFSLTRPGFGQFGGVGIGVGQCFIIWSWCRWPPASLQSGGRIHNCWVSWHRAASFPPWPGKGSPPGATRPSSQAGRELEAELTMLCFRDWDGSELRGKVLEQVT